MRYFRIPSFTGIEAHRDDADRGSLCVVEGCVPKSSGGIRSAPIWEDVGEINIGTATSTNQIYAIDEKNGNSFLFVARGNEVHDMLILSEENTEVESLGESYAVATVTPYSSEQASLTPIGNRLYALGDGSEDATFTGLGPITNKNFSTNPDSEIYSQEFESFPNCKFFVQGPKKTIFGAGDPDNPLTVYISEPAGVTVPNRDSIFSDDLSSVQILGSNAKYITALTSRGDQVIVHTDKGCHILFAPKPDQAETGYRVEQAPATNFSASVSIQVVGGEGGTQPYWVGFDGQIYKDESVARGAEDFKTYSDPNQVSWKAKGVWDKQHPTNLSKSFATYSAQAGMYWAYTEDKFLLESIKGNAPVEPFGLTYTLLSEERPSAPQELSFEHIADAPSEPTELSGAVLQKDRPSHPIGLTLTESVPDKPARVSFNGLEVIPDAPDSTLSLTYETIPDAPDSRLGLTYETIPDAPVSTFSLIYEAIPDAPSDTFSLTYQTIPDAPDSTLGLTYEAVPDAPDSTLGLTYEAIPDAPSDTFSLTYQTIPDAPTVPTSLSESTIHYPPSVPQELIFTLTIVVPSVPTGLTLDRVIPDAPSVPTALSEEVIPDAPSVPTALSEGVIPDAPSVPTALSEGVIPDAPSVPTLLNATAVHIPPSIPQQLTVTWFYGKPGVPTGLEALADYGKPGVPTGLGALADYGKPSVPIGLIFERFVGNQLPSQPGVPRGLGAVADYGKPGVPADLEALADYGKPGIPTGLIFERFVGNQLPNPPSVPTGLELDEIVPDSPSVPTGLGAVVTILPPSVPRGLTGVASPGVPTVLTFEAYPDRPKPPYGLTLVNLELNKTQLNTPEFIVTSTIDEVTVLLNPVPHASEYEVFFGPTEYQGEFRTIKANGSLSVTFSDTLEGELIQGLTYYVRVLALGYGEYIDSKFSEWTTVELKTGDSPFIIENWVDSLEDLPKQPELGEAVMYQSGDVSTLYVFDQTEGTILGNKWFRFPFSRSQIGAQKPGVPTSLRHVKTEFGFKDRPTSPRELGYTSEVTKPSYPRNLKLSGVLPNEPVSPTSLSYLTTYSPVQLERPDADGYSFKTTSTTLKFKIEPVQNGYSYRTRLSKITDFWKKDYTNSVLGVAYLDFSTVSISNSGQWWGMEVIEVEYQNLEPNTYYTFETWAIGDQKDFLNSNITSTSSKTDPTPPTNPTGLQASYEYEFGDRPSEPTELTASSIIPGQEILTDYRPDLLHLNTTPLPIYMHSATYTWNVMDDRWFGFQDNQDILYNATLPTSKTELDNFNTTNSNLLNKPKIIEAFFPDTNTESSNYLAPYKSSSTNSVDNYHYWVEMNWAGLRDWSALLYRRRGWSSWYSWNAVIDSIYPAWYLTFKTDEPSSNTFSWWVCAGGDGKYRISLVKNSALGLDGNTPSRNNILDVATGLEYSEIWGEHSITSDNKLYKVWITPDPGPRPTQSSFGSTGVLHGVDNIIFDDMKGVTEPTEGYYRHPENDKYYKYSEYLWLSK